MPAKKGITKKELAYILKSYSIKKGEFELLGNEGLSFKSRFARGYVISFLPEIQHGDEKTGRIVVSHSRDGGKRTFQDVWGRDAGGRLQFLFRNPWDRPFTDYDYIKGLEIQIDELKEAGRSLQAQLKKCRAARAHPVHPELQGRVTSLEAENRELQERVKSLTEENQGLIKKTGHNARGAGRKADPQKLEARAQKVQELLADGKSAAEIQKEMRISRSTYFRYKKFIKN